MNRIKVQSIEQLNELLDKGKHDYVLLLAGGVLRSSKYITWNGTDTYYVLHLIDDSEEEYTADELMSSNIGTGIKNGALYCETN